MNVALKPSLKLIYILIGIAILLNLSGLFNTLMDPDATRYATISKTMVLRHNFLELFCDGTDWLDKPHFPFWLTAFSFELFGFSSWAYKLPGILFLFLGAGYTYLLAKRLYNKEIALISVLILLTAEHIILSNNDVRAEPYLTGLIIASVYHFYRCYQRGKYGHLVLGALFAACAIMTKGIFALIPIGGAIAGDLLIRKDWKTLFQLKWILAALLTGIFILPELYSLYYQFDLHPEKVVFGRTHVSGLKFFFWDSQFGRFMNTGPIKGEGDPAFFLHTTLWAFLPWSVMLYIAMVATIRKHFKQPAKQEWLTICGSLLTFLLFSASKFQLPHYLNIVFPFFAIITAQYLLGIQSEKAIKWLVGIQYVIIVLLVLAPFLVQYIYQPEYVSVFVIVLMAIILLLIVFLNKIWALGIRQRIIFRTVLACCFANLYLNLVFYPSLLRYQGGSQAAFWINQNNPDHLPVALLHPSYSLEFYLNQPVYYLDTTRGGPAKTYLLYIPDEKIDEVTTAGRKLAVIKSLDNFTITMLDMQFFNKASRQETLRTRKADIAKVEEP